MTKEADNQESPTSPPKTGGGGVWAAVLMAIGVILLLNNLNLLSWEIWVLLWQFWPVILILAGIQIILGKSTLAKFIMVIVTLAVIAFITALALAPTELGIDRWLKKNFPQLPEIRIPDKWEEEELNQLTLPPRYFFRYQHHRFSL